MNAVETTGLTKFYGRARGVTDVTLEVERGDFFGFIGPNGAGKSTTIRTLLGLIFPTSGAAKVLGFDVVTQKTEVLSRTGYLPSETAFYHGMRVREVLALAAKLRGKDCREESKRLCSVFELDPERRIDELSLGNRKKVGIVCALQHRPELYVLDEPTSGLDPLMQQVFFAELTERAGDGATVFLSSHVLSEVARHCRRAAVIREGRVIACDSVEKLSHTGVKKVVLRGLRRKPSLPGFENLEPEGSSLSFLFTGSSRDLLAALSDADFDDFNVADPELDEVFMHFYEKEAAK